MRRADPPRASVLVRIGTVLVTIVLAAYIVAVWAMTAKPTRLSADADRPRWPSRSCPKSPIQTDS